METGDEMPEMGCRIGRTMQRGLQRLRGNYCTAVEKITEELRREEIGSWRKMEMGNQAMVMVAIVMVAGMASLVEGQLGNTPSCAADMTNCVNYLNSTNPPASCCDPLRQTVSTQLKCLCDLLNDPSLFQSMGINLTQAEQLPQNCGMPNTVAACSQRKITTYHVPS
ncbi:hypothetical protein NE237_013842 [Protea cynaroides]|uniref:Bifunctional inhibitor/plant lipid transfer protein/seed storage helical domain-containing protein n=1 Tax=Protea cynaroides TaxID=273540 RepID=A0A9Q0H0P0_9MAGN|nr:hypothetical protein NE237_013842 [Protea cynaroides]